MNEVFLDTSFAISLSSITDQHHARAITKKLDHALSDRIKETAIILYLKVI